MVFQFVSLYPHLKISEEHRLPARRRGASPRPRSRASSIGSPTSSSLATNSSRYPGALPPGARQKVALARAVIRDPAVLLLDEPLSAIDEQFREEMRWELGHLQRQLGVTTIYVTHDQREAMSLADRIVLMNNGRIVQVSEPDRMFFDPVDVFAGQFIGSPSMNLIDLAPVEGGLRLGDSDVTLTAARDLLPQWALSAGRPLKLGVRPLNVHLTDDPAAGVALAGRRHILRRPRTLLLFPHRRYGPSGRRQARVHRPGRKAVFTSTRRGCCSSMPTTGRRVGAEVAA